MRALKKRAKRENRRSAAKPRARGFSLKSSESQHLFCEIRAKDKINNSRKQNRAFSGYARGWFLTIPYGHCSLPPRLRRLIHENLAVLRFSVSLWFYKINNSAPQFAKTFAFAGKVKPRDYVICVPLNHRAARKTPIAPSKARAMGLS